MEFERQFWKDEDSGYGFGWQLEGDSAIVTFRLVSGDTVSTRLHTVPDGPAWMSYLNALPYTSGGSSREEALVQLAGILALLVETMEQRGHAAIVRRAFRSVGRA